MHYLPKSPVVLRPIIANLWLMVNPGFFYFAQRHYISAHNYSPLFQRNSTEFPFQAFIFRTSPVSYSKNALDGTRSGRSAEKLPIVIYLLILQ